jgi:hypothetical protein
MNGPTNPYSLQNLASGSVVAMSDAERKFLATMLASDPDFAQMRESNRRLAGLLHQRRFGAVASLSGLNQARSKVGSQAFFNPYRQVVLLSGELNTPKSGDFLTRPSLTGLDRASNLATTILWGKSLGNSSSFLQAATNVESQLSAVLDGVAAKAFENKRVHIGNIGQALKLYGGMKLTAQLATAAVSFLAAVTPSSISDIYMNLGDRGPYKAGSPPWPLDVNAVVDAQIFVVPQSPGGQVLTPLGVVGLFVDFGGGPKASAAFQKLMRNPELAKKMEAVFVNTLKLLGKWHVDAAASYFASYGNNPNATPNFGKWSKTPGEWASKVQYSLNLPAKNLPAIEMNDARFVRLVPTPNVGISEGPNQRLQIRGLTPGPARIVGSLDRQVPVPFLEGGKVGGTPTFVIGIQVNGKPKEEYARCVLAVSDWQTIWGVMINGKCEPVK